MNNWAASLLIATACVVPCPWPTAVQASDSDPSAGTIAANGVAREAVSPDRIEIDFALSTRQDSFAAAEKLAAGIADRLRAIRVPVDGVTQTVVWDLTFMKQRGISWGKGKELEHRFALSAERIPDGRAREVLVRLVDIATEIEPRLTVDAYRALLSEAKTAEVRRRLLARAAQDAEGNAKAIAAAGNLTFLGAKSVNAAGTVSSESEIELYDFDSRVFHRASFSVDTALPSRLEMSVRIVVVFNARSR